MAKFEIKFIDRFNNNFIKVEKIVKQLFTKNEDLIRIKLCTEVTEIDIMLDKSTAIKFAKTLRTEINKITESEVSNG